MQSSAFVASCHVALAPAAQRASGQLHFLYSWTLEIDIAILRGHDNVTGHMHASFI